MCFVSNQSARHILQPVYSIDKSCACPRGPAVKKSAELRLRPAGRPVASFTNPLADQHVHLRRRRQLLATSNPLGTVSHELRRGGPAIRLTEPFWQDQALTVFRIASRPVAASNPLGARTTPGFRAGGRQIRSKIAHRRDRAPWFTTTAVRSRWRRLIRSENRHVPRLFRDCGRSRNGRPLGTLSSRVCRVFVFRRGGSVNMRCSTRP